MSSPAFDPNATLGAIQIGVLVSSFLFGIMTVQVFLYFAKFPEDRLALKLLVGTIWVLELAHTITVCHFLYIMVIVDYGHPERFIKAPASLSAAIIFSGFIGPLVQGFFAERVRVVSGKLLIPIICWFLSFLRLLGSLIAAGEGFEMVTLAQYEVTWLWLLTSILAVGACVDVLVAASLCYYLRQKRLQSFKGTAGMIDKLMAWTIQTGLLTSVAAVTMLICFVAMKNNMVWLAFFMFLARLFSNSLLASLNARSILRAANLNVVDLSSGTRGTNSVAFADPQRGVHHTAVSVQMSRLTKTSADAQNYGDRSTVYDEEAPASPEDSSVKFDK